jgi:hypothetical protein
MKKLIVATALVLSTFIGTASATVAATENWKCKRMRGDQSVLITATFHKNGEGSIRTADVSYKARTYFDGFDRRWDFGDDDPPGYSFLIKTNNLGLLYDFGTIKSGESTTTPDMSMILKCSIANE